MIKECIQQLAEREDMTKAQAAQAFSNIMGGGASSAQIAAFITALKMKGETTDEIAGASQAMLKFMKPIHPKVNGFLLDTCGTGGDKLNTFNISTTAMFIAAGAGCIIAKHGNRAASGSCGSADVLEKLGVNIGLSPVKTRGIIERTGIGFMFAPVHHGAMRHAASARGEIGIKTIFNILGPIANPANAETKLLGAYGKEAAEKIVRALKSGKPERALVVHGADGMDEITTTSKTIVFELNKEKLKKYYIAPNNFGFRQAKLSELRGGNSARNAAILLNLLKCRESKAKQGIAVLNAAAAIYANKKAGSISEGVELARESLESGAAFKKLEQLKKESVK